MEVEEAGGKEGEGPMSGEGAGEADEDGLTVDVARERGSAEKI